MSLMCSVELQYMNHHFEPNSTTLSDFPIDYQQERNVSTDTEKKNGKYEIKNMSKLFLIRKVKFPSFQSQNHHETHY